MLGTVVAPYLMNQEQSSKVSRKYALKAQFGPNHTDDPTSSFALNIAESIPGIAVRSRNREPGIALAGGSLPDPRSGHIADSDPIRHPKSVVSLGELMTAMADVMEPAVRAAHGKLIVDFVSEHALLYCDETSLLTALTMLAESVRADKHPCLYIGSRIERDSITIVVRDCRELVGSPLQQVHEPGDDHLLGRAVDIVEDCGGTLRWWSLEDGAMSCVHMPRHRTDESGTSEVCDVH